MSRLDIVLFGASGFTGLHALEELAAIARQRGLTWAVAGRSREKLLSTLKDISNKTGKDLSSTKLLIADVQDEESLKAMCGQAKVLVNCCGPYLLYGEAVVKAAIQSGTHYVDVSGEPNFIELMHLKYEEEARAAGVYIVSACAFESIPADLGVIFLQQNFGGVVNTVDCYMSAETPAKSINYGTWHSLINNLAHFTEIRAIRKKIHPTPLPDFTPGKKFKFPVHKRYNGWSLPFPSNDESSVYRTQRYLYERDGSRPAQFTNYVKFESFMYTIVLGFAMLLFFVMSQFKFTRKALLDYPGIFTLGVITKGPPESVVSKAAYEYCLYGEGWDESEAANIGKLPPRKSVLVKVSGVNPGYGMTVVGVLYSAIAILDEQKKMPPGGGVMTPGFAFAKTSLVKNLQDNGVSFQVVHSKLHKD